MVSYTDLQRKGVGGPGECKAEEGIATVADTGFYADGSELEILLEVSSLPDFYVQR